MEVDGETSSAAAAADEEGENSKVITGTTKAFLKDGFTVGQTPADLLSFRGQELVFRPKTILHGRPGDAHTHIARALIQALDPTPCYAIDLQTLNQGASSGKGGMEDVLVTKISEARNHAPCVLFLPDLQLWVWMP